MKKVSEEEVLKIRKDNWRCFGLSGRCEWDNIDELPLTEGQKACVLEWLTQRLERTFLSQELEIFSGHCKSYDPLSIDVGHKVAHSYVMDMWDGGRHHSYKNLKQVEDYIFLEFFEEVERELHPSRFCGWCGKRWEGNNHEACELPELLPTNLTPNEV